MRALATGPNLSIFGINTTIRWFLVSILAYGCAGGDEPVDDPQIADSHTKFLSCLGHTGSQTLDVMTWNLKEFPLQGVSTITELVKIIDAQDADIIAVQEISDFIGLEGLAGALPNWRYQIVLETGLDLAFIYKISEITILEPITKILEDDSFSFPRTPVMIKVEHLGGIKAYLINIHLKCCGGEDNYNRRVSASSRLKTFIDNEMPNDPVIILGDFNDDLTNTEFATPFSNFLNDDTGFSFADFAIAAGSESNWSYPSWPSHIDHILITDELFVFLGNTSVLQLDGCDQSYFDLISDHRPVISRFEFNIE